jgi:hypothetical protein
MTTANNKVCNYSCSCIREECSFKHYINNVELRKEFKLIVDEKFDKSIHNETDPDGIRNIPCIYSYLCNKEECGYKHRCSFIGRKEIQNEWYKKHPYSMRKQLTLEDGEFLKKLAGKYMMTHEEAELIQSFSKLLRR